MRWKFWETNDVDLEATQKALNESRLRTAIAKEKAEQTSDVVVQLRRHRESNHFAEKIAAVLFGTED